MKRSFAKSHRMFAQVKERIPLATQTFSKSYLQYVENGAPLFITRGKGSHIWDVDGNEYIDYINGLLPVMLGYGYKPVDRAITSQLKKGITFPLPSPLEDELARLLIKHIPCAEMVRYGKNGSDVTTGAIRLARAVTGREHVANCGYHGWHDWHIGSTTRHLGVPECTRELTHPFKYNDIDSLKKIFKKYRGKMAAVIMEPMNYADPQDRFLQKVKELAHKNGALLIFDEVITGFRWGLGGAQKYLGVTPDLATFGKSMANGMPISALVGKKKYMKRIADIFYSFTNGGEALSLAAAIAVIKEMEKKDIVGAIWKKGEYLQKKVEAVIKANGLEEIIKIKGKPCWQIFMVTGTDKFTDLEIKSFIQQEIIQEGILWYGSHNMSYAHSKQDLDRTIKAYKIVLPELKHVMDKGTLKKKLVGRPITNIFKVR